MWISTLRYDLLLKASSSLKNDRVFQGIRRTLRIDGLGVSWVIESWSGTGSEVVWSSNDLDLETTITKDDSGSKTWEHHVGPQGTSNMLSESL